jgi:hypothetical protein
MTPGPPLGFGLGPFRVLALVALLVVPSVLAGALVSVVTLPLLYVTGFGFLTTHRSPARGEAFPASAVQHTAIGTGAFGTAMLGSLLASEFLPAGIEIPAVGQVNGGLAVTVLVLTAGLAGTALASNPRDGRSLSARSVLALAGVWYGYPL